MISVILPIAYDYGYAYDTIRSAYEIADEVIVGVDRDRLTWSRQKFAFDREAFLAQIASFDAQSKVRLFEDDFHTEEHPMNNETRERNLLSLQCKPGNWIVHLDADERLLNAQDFRLWLKRFDIAKDASAEFITVIKVIGKQCLVVTRPWEKCPVATTVQGGYQKARRTGREEVLSNLKILHFSWGRTRAELEQKVANWGHAKDFDTAAFLRLWDSIDLNNYASLKNFHPLYGPIWPGLTIMNLNK